MEEGGGEEEEEEEEGGKEEGKRGAEGRARPAERGRDASSGSTGRRSTKGGGQW